MPARYITLPSHSHQPTPQPKPASARAHSQHAATPKCSRPCRLGRFVKTHILNCREIRKNTFSSTLRLQRYAKLARAAIRNGVIEQPAYKVDAVHNVKKRFARALGCSSCTSSIPAIAIFELFHMSYVQRHEVHLGHQNEVRRQGMTDPVQDGSLRDVMRLAMCVWRQRRTAAKVLALTSSMSTQFYSLEGLQDLTRIPGLYFAVKNMLQYR